MNQLNSGYKLFQMNIKIIFFSLFASLVLSKSAAQELYLPRSIQPAYDRGTRSLNGTPGKNYWQNKGVYHIKLNINPPERMVKGFETIVYINNSPDTLKYLNFKLIMNNHRATAPRLGHVSKNYLTDGLFVDTYKENGIEKEWKNGNDGTNKVIGLEKPLLPNERVKLEINWHYKLSKQSGREGVLDSTSFFLAYFYPRVAVYDDYAGWDRMNHVLSQEFYNDFNDYTLEVSVPNNYIVWATGTLENPKAVLQKEYAEQLQKTMNSDEIVQIASAKEIMDGLVTQQNKTNTWVWKATHITDVALALSNHYNWDATSALVDSKTGRRASVQVAYDDSSTGFQKMAGYAQHALKWFSANLPGVPYPFPKMTVVRGFADMEYPMMANDSERKNGNFMRFVAEHEIAHSWFPFYMGINETRYGFMDEGWATTFEYFIGIADLGKEQATKNYQNFRVKSWSEKLYLGQDLPIIIPTNLMSGRPMGNNEYGKASLGYLALQDLLGENQFKKALQGYMADWNGKHPIPWDFFYSINRHSGRNLNWFWNAWYFSRNYIDVAVKSVKTKKRNTIITLKNIGGMPAPIDIRVNFENGTNKVFHQTPVIWKKCSQYAEIELKDTEKIIKVTLEGGIWMDADMSNNVWEK